MTYKVSIWITLEDELVWRLFNNVRRLNSSVKSRKFYLHVSLQRARGWTEESYRRRPAEAVGCSRSCHRCRKSRISWAREPSLLAADAAAVVSLAFLALLPLRRSCFEPSSVDVLRSAACGLLRIYGGLLRTCYRPAASPASSWSTRLRQRFAGCRLCFVEDSYGPRHHQNRQVTWVFVVVCSVLCSNTEYCQL